MGEHAMCPTRARQFDQFHVVSVNKNMLCSNKLKQYFVESKYKVVKISPKIRMKRGRENYKKT